MKTSTTTDEQQIRIQGARVHNLRDVSLDIPRDQFVVLTGVSGSGKSSLAFDTLFAEGQRQFIESLSVHARQFMHQLERPDVDLIEGLQPTISIDQRRTTANPRSTVATVTEIYDYLRLLYARLGQAHCPGCGRTIRQQSPERIFEDLMRLPDSTRLILLAPIIRGRKGQHAEVLEQIRRAGFVRARVDGTVFPVEDVPELDRQKLHDIDAVVDRIVLRSGVESRLNESLKLAIKHGDGLTIACYETQDDSGHRTGQWLDRLYSTKYACPDCNISFLELEPRSFSFNSPYGACPACEGLGSVEHFDPELVLPDLSKSIAGGAVAAIVGTTASSQKLYRGLLEHFGQRYQFTMDMPLDQLHADVLDAVLHGDAAKHPDDSLPGVLDMLQKEYESSRSKKQLQRLDAFRDQVVCRECGGSRLQPEARSVYLGNSDSGDLQRNHRAIHELTRLSVVEAIRFFRETWSPEPEQQFIGEPIIREIVARLEFLERVGLSYLTLDRSADTLSGGEMQRVRLASGLGSGLVGVCYILDEPSIGLHPRDNDRLIRAMRNLQQQGNTLLVVEHDEAVMREADWLIDIGPGAGLHGGRIVAEGTPQQVAAHDESLTGRYLQGELQVEVPAKRRKVAKTRSIVIEDVTTNNLKNVTATFPLSALVCVTGVSGSGKSSLLNETLAKALVRRLNGSGPKPGPHGSLRGASRIDKVIQIDQSPIGRSPRSSPITYCGAFDEIRKVFAQTRDAKRRGYKVGRFSFNVKGGRCEACQGRGQQKIQMNFLPDLYVNCPECNGRRFNRQTLDVRYRGHSIADVLDMRVEDAVGFFENFPTIVRLLRSLQDVGLGYMNLGQASTTLSGGEAQRVKLATELARVDTGNTLYILDEPTTGLHAHDIRQLVAVLQRLVDLGNTVIVIEHNLDVIKTADWIIDVGPEGGESGGYITATGTPEEIAALDDNHTGRFLNKVLYYEPQRL